MLPPKRSCCTHQALQWVTTLRFLCLRLEMMTVLQGGGEEAIVFEYQISAAASCGCATTARSELGSQPLQGPEVRGLPLQEDACFQDQLSFGGAARPSGLW